MVTAIKSAESTSFKSFFIAPWEQLALRVASCAQSVDLTQIDHPARPLGDRVVDALVALALIIPLINTIIWLAMSHLGVETLTKTPTAPEFTPWPEAIAAGEKAPVVIRQIIAPTAGTVPSKVEEYTTEDKESGKAAYRVSTRIEYYKDSIVVLSTSPSTDPSDTTPNIYSKSVYDNEWALQSMDYKDKLKKIDAQFTREGDTVKLEGIGEGKQLPVTYIKLPKATTPWIQQYSQGMRPFIASTQQSTYCCSIDPKDFTLVKALLTKTKVEKLAEYGPTVQIGLKAASAPKSWFGNVRYSSHNPMTGAQYKESWSIPAIYSATSKVV